MQNLVNIQADDMGNVVRQSDPNSEYGFVRLTQSKAMISPTGWFSPKNLSALILGKTEELQGVFKADQKLSGNIIVKEQFEPFNKNDPDRDYKYAGDTGIICCVDGQPIYRKTFFVADLTATDVLIVHNNGDAIREANGYPTMTDATKVTSASEFGINTESVETVEVVEEVVEDSEEEVVDVVEKDEVVDEEIESFDL
jgi:hypothetical protein